MEIPGMDNPNSRQALIYAALSGCKGDPVGPWTYPPDVDTIIAWARSHYQSSEEDLKNAFIELVSERLFLPIHQKVFDLPHYYCSFDSKFLADIPDGQNYVAEVGYISLPQDKLRAELEKLD